MANMIDLLVTLAAIPAVPLIASLLNASSGMACVIVGWRRPTKSNFYNDGLVIASLLLLAGSYVLVCPGCVGVLQFGCCTHCFECGLTILLAILAVSAGAIYSLAQQAVKRRLLFLGMTNIAGGLALPTLISLLSRIVHCS